jgi:NAD-dependent deacetylase
MDFNERIAKLNKMIADARHIVFFTGAGISTGSGIPDFRSADGLYATAYGIKDKSPEYMLSDDCLYQHPEAFFKYLRDYMDYREAEPNIAHRKISELQLTRDVSVITQNIDGLHERTGTEKVYAVHGTMARYVCTNCQHDLFVPEDVMDGNYDNMFNVPKCPLCGEGTIRPDIVLYGEGMAHPAWQDAQMAGGQADLMIVVGSSLTVYPAAYIPMYRWGKGLVIINREETHLDGSSELVFHEDIKDVFDKIIIPKE